MRRAAMLVLFALLAAVVFAQNPASANTPAGNPQNSGTMTTGTSPNQNTQMPGEGAQANPPATMAGQNGQLPNNQNTGQGANQNNNPNNGQAAASPATNNQGANRAATSNATTQENSNPENSSSNGSLGQRPAVPSNSSGQVAAGTEIHAALDTPLSTKTSKPGDRFTATVTQPVRGTNGSEIVPTGARIEGEVSEAEQGKVVAALRGKGKLNLRFRDVVLPNGQSLPLTATLVSVHSTNGKESKSADQEGQMESSTRGKDVAKDVGIGAGIGTVAGLLFGGPLKGLAIGALAGGGYVLATKGKEVNLPAQTGMVIKLDQPLGAQGSTSSRMQR